jgi:hypothetical protein
MTSWVVPQLWKGQRVFIIAGGPSVDPAQVARISGRSIAIKHAVLLKPDADFLFWAGTSWHVENANLIAAHKGGQLVKRKVDDGIPDWILQVERSKPGADGIVGFSDNRRQLGGLCSGGSALNLAVHLGAAEIVLVGYDLSGRHWFRGHPAPATAVQHARHREAIERMTAPIAARGVKVWNTSPASTLTGFEKRGLDDFII